MEKWKNGRMEEEEWNDGMVEWWNIGIVEQIFSGI